MSLVWQSHQVPSVAGRGRAEKQVRAIAPLPVKSALECSEKLHDCLHLVSSIVLNIENVFCAALESVITVGYLDSAHHRYEAPAS